jgi:hypothetical protein
MPLLPRLEAAPFAREPWGFKDVAAIPADVDFLNREIGGFLDLVTQRGKKLQ